MAAVVPARVRLSAAMAEERPYSLLIRLGVILAPILAGVLLWSYYHPPVSVFSRKPAAAVPASVTTRAPNASELAAEPADPVASPGAAAAAVAAPASSAEPGGANSALRPVAASSQKAATQSDPAANTPPPPRRSQARGSNRRPSVRKRGTLANRKRLRHTRRSRNWTRKSIASSAFAAAAEPTFPDLRQRVDRNCPTRNSAFHLQSSKDAIAAFIDDLLALGNRERDRIVPALMGLRPNEPVLLDAFRIIFLDHSRGLIASARSIRGRTDAITAVFDSRCRRLAGLALASSAEEAAQCRFQVREHRPVPHSPDSRHAYSCRGPTHSIMARHHGPPALSLPWAGPAAYNSKPSNKCCGVTSVDPSAIPSTRAGRKRRWKACTTCCVGRSYLPGRARPFFFRLREPRRKIKGRDPSDAREPAPLDETRQHVMRLVAGKARAKARDAGLDRGIERKPLPLPHQR